MGLPGVADFEVGDSGHIQATIRTHTIELSNTSVSRS